MSGVAKRLPEKRPAGMPTQYDPAFCELATNYCLLGAIDEDLAAFFEVSVVTLNAWKKKHPAFKRALDRGKSQADAKVAASLFQRANGYSHKAEKIFLRAEDDKPVRAKYIEHYPPSDTACIFWLKNRRPKDWSDRAGEGAGPVQNNITVNVSDEMAIAQRIAFLLMGGMPAPKMIEGGK